MIYDEAGRLYFDVLDIFKHLSQIIQNFAAKSRDCSFELVGKSFFHSGFGLPMRKNSTHPAMLSHVLMQYKDYDIWQRCTLRKTQCLRDCPSEI